MKVFFSDDLNTVATFWQVFRKDGVTLGFSSHNRDLVFDGLRHRAAPGMVPAAIQLTSEVANDSAEVEGALSHDSISEADLSNGLFDEAHIVIGAVDWETLERLAVYSGRIGQVDHDRHSFRAELRSAKYILDYDLVPRASPTCRATFCGPGCGLSAARFTSRRNVLDRDEALNAILVDASVGAAWIDGQVRMLSGPQTGLIFGVVNSQSGWLTLDRPMANATPIGAAVELLEGCDHTLGTCADRFGNARNFRGEPFLPGNDLLTRYGTPN